MPPCSPKSILILRETKQGQVTPHSRPRRSRPGWYFASDQKCGSLTSRARHGARHGEDPHTKRASADFFINILHKSEEYNKIWQAFAVLIPTKTVGVMGDSRTYENLIALRAVTSLDGMTADWYNLPHDILSKCSTEIINKVKGVNRVVYDITSKPPGTIEWE